MPTEVFSCIWICGFKAYAYRTDLHISQNSKFDVHDRMQPLERKLGPN
jgi:hypothetical protein